MSKLLLEFGPVLAFFVAYTRWDFFVATAVFMAACLVALTASWLRDRRVPRSLAVSTVFVVVLGGLTLWLNDETFLQLKLTFVNALFALALVVGLALGRQPLRALLGSALRLTDTGWRRFTACFAAYFVCVAIANELVRRNLSMDVWVGFKTFGLPASMLVFALSLTPLVQRYELPEDADEAEAEASTSRTTR